MPALAFSFPPVLSRKTFTTQDVLLMSHRFKMIRVPTKPVLALVVNLEPRRDRADKHLIRQNVDWLWNSEGSDSAVLAHSLPVGCTQPHGASVCSEHRAGNHFVVKVQEIDWMSVFDSIRHVFTESFVTFAASAHVIICRVSLCACGASASRCGRLLPVVLFQERARVSSLDGAAVLIFSRRRCCSPCVG